MLRNIVFRVVVGMAAVGLLAFAWRAGADDGPKKGDRSNSFAVVELFTSEGCSSCPPADVVLADLVAQAKKDGRPVYCLSFHVDYWNQLGWKDPYSAGAYSKRQREYANGLGEDGIYTPQMIVNGVEQFVGSKKARAATAVSTALEKSAHETVALRLEVRNESGKLAVVYDVSSPPKGATLNLALVEGGLSQRVARGENGGRLLKHENVVRAFRTIALPAAGKGATEIELPERLRKAKAALIGFVQEKGMKRIVAANGVELE